MVVSHKIRSLCGIRTRELAPVYENARDSDEMKLRTDEPCMRTAASSLRPCVRIGWQTHRWKSSDHRPCLAMLCEERIFWGVEDIDATYMCGGLCEILLMVAESFALMLG